MSVKIEYIINIIFLIVLLFDYAITQNNSDLIFDQRLADWKNYQSNDVIDYVFKLDELTSEEMQNYNWNLVIRTSINGLKPIEYQITLREKDLYNTQKTTDSVAKEYLMIFEYPVEYSVRDQAVKLCRINPNASPKQIAQMIKVKRDTIRINNSFKYSQLIEEIDTLSMPVIFPNYVIIDGTECQIFLQTISVKNYLVLPFGNKDIPFTNWIVRLFKETIEYFNALNPYP